MGIACAGYSGSNPAVHLAPLCTWRWLPAPQQHCAHVQRHLRQVSPPKQQPPAAPGPVSLPPTLNTPRQLARVSATAWLAGVSSRLRVAIKKDL